MRNEMFPADSARVAGKSPTGVVSGRQSEPAANRMAGTVRSSWTRDWLFGVLLVLTTLIAYHPVWHGSLVWDDDSWTTKISGLLRDVAGLRTMWADPGALQQYYPLTGTTFWLDYQLWGFRTLPYHVENVLLHAFAALLFWQLLRRLELPGAWLAGAIFALHPVMVESVGWITERKNVLSLVFYLGALLAYGRFARFWKADNPLAPPAARAPVRFWGAYVLAFSLFLAAEMSKATAFSLPAVLLLVCWWKRGRVRRADVLPSLPFFAVGISLGLLTAWLEKHTVGAQGPEWAISFPERCLIAGRALWFYTGKLFWPTNLCFLYPQWKLAAGSFAQWLYPVTAGGTLLLLWLNRRRIGRGPVTAALFFAGTLFPVLGFLNAYFMRYSFVCDHWMYLSSLGLIALGAGWVVWAAGHVGARALVYVLAAILLPVLGGLTWRQSKLYTNDETLWQLTLARNPEAFMAHNNLGKARFQRGEADAAIVHFQKALAIRPDFAEAHNNLGRALFEKGRTEEAIAHFRKALETQPRNAAVYYNLGTAFYVTGQAALAIGYLQRALEFDPTLAEVHNNLGNVLCLNGQVDEAIAHFQKALQIQPGFPEAHKGLGNALLCQGRVEEAITHFTESLRTNPGDAALQCRLAVLLGVQGKINQSIQRYRTVLRTQPDLPEALNNLAWILATQPDPGVRNGVEAVDLAERACGLTDNQQAIFLGTLAAAYAEAGRFAEAVTTAERAEARAWQANQVELAARNRQLGELYRSGQCCRDMP